MTFKGWKVTMRQVALLVYPEVSLAQLTGMAEIFYFANELHRYQHPAAEPLYQLQYVQLDGASLISQGPLSVQCQAFSSAVDLLLLAGARHHQAPDLLAMMAYFRQRRHQFIELKQQGGQLAAACNGTFALAATGLLDEVETTTCWFLEDFFRQQFPKVRLCAEHLVCQSAQLATAGATTGYIALCLQLIRDHQGANFASQLSKLLLNEPANLSQAPYRSVQQLLPHQDQRIAEIQHHLQRHLASELDLAALAERFFMSTRTLIRRFKAATGDTPMAHLQKLRIEKAKRLLESSLLTVEQIISEVGYQDVSSFRKLFVQYTSLTPKGYRERFYLADTSGQTTVSAKSSAGLLSA